ncbi:MAG TPA: hypothetical protein PLL54_05435 [Dermatophilaceae bacterium]|nr:hypothetical protein [Dermatophilaceae bacterium]
MTTPGGGSTVARPVANRMQRPSWRDSRVLVGLLLVLSATALGAKVIASADDRVPMFVASAGLKPGDRIGPDTVRRVDIQLGEGVAGYLSAATVVPSDLLVLREVRAGELVPLSAVGTQQAVTVQPVSVRVDATSAAALVVGSVVDVWVSRRDVTTTQERFQEAAILLRGVTVSRVPASQGGFGATAATASVQILVVSSDIQKLITAQDDQARLTLVPVPGSLRATGS